MHKQYWIECAAKTRFKVCNLIDGKIFPAERGQAIYKYAARNGELIVEFGAGAAEEVESAIQAASKSFSDGRWSSKSVHERKNVLKKLADLVEANSDELALIESMDVGKPISAAFGDVITAASALRAAANAVDQVNAPSAMDGGTFTYQLRKPIGVVGAIVGWNFPLVLAAQKVGPALAMGNSLVLKPSEFTSLSAYRLAELALEAGVPEGVFNVVNGIGTEVGDALARHNQVRLLSFTGSSATGKRLMEAAGQSNMKRLILECGGKSPFIVFNDYEGDLDALARDIVVDTAFVNQGALCVSSTRVLLQESIRDRLLPKILEQAQSIVPADPLDPETTFGAIMNAAHMEKVLGYVQSGLDEGAELLTGGTRINEETGGYYLSPAIFDRVDPGQRIAREEVFGPLVSLFTFKTEEEAIKLANDTEYGLAAYAATSSARCMQRLARDLDAGIIVLLSSLDSPPGGHVLGIEPHKQSGFGTEGGTIGLTAYSVTSHVSVMF